MTAPEIQGSLQLSPGTRSDFIITQHPEFNLGRLASERGALLKMAGKDIQKPSGND